MGLKTPILPTKFQGNQSIGSRKDGFFLNDFITYGHGNHICRDQTHIY